MANQPVDIHGIHLLEATVHERFARMRLLLVIEGVAIALLSIAVLSLALSLP